MALLLGMSGSGGSFNISSSSRRRFNPDHASHPQEIIPTLTSVESKNILALLKQIPLESSFYRPDPILVQKLNTTSVPELKKILKLFFKQMIEANPIKDPVKLVERLSTVLPFERIQECFREDPIATSKAMKEQAKLYLENHITVALSTRLSSILDTIVSAIGSIVRTIGIANLFTHAESELHADFKSQRVVMLLNLFGTLLSLLLPVIGATSAGLVVGGIFLTTTILSFLWPYIKPIPTELPAKAKNWTKELEMGDFVALGRKETLDEMANILKRNRHVMLIGPSRVGKSLTAKAFARALLKSQNLYPELRGKVVFAINTAKLIEQGGSFLGGGNDILDNIASQIGRHGNNVILVLDEIHMACKNKQRICDELKTFLDSKGLFKYVIGITTQKEYEEYVAPNNAFARRFENVTIKNMNKDETLLVLSSTVLSYDSKPILEDGVLEYIYNRASKLGEPEPFTSLNLLDKCIEQTQNTQISPLEKAIGKLSTEITSLESQAAAYRGKTNDGGRIKRLKEKRTQVQLQLDTQQGPKNALFKAKEIFDRVTKQMYKTVLKVSSISSQIFNTKEKRDITQFILYHQFFSSALEAYIEKTARENNLKAIIDRKLVNGIFEKEEAELGKSRAKAASRRETSSTSSAGEKPTHSIRNRFPNIVSIHEFG